MGIARHLVLRHYRRASTHTLDDHQECPADTPPPPDLLENVERVNIVRAALLCLDDDRRRVLEDKYAGGLSIAEIAARTGRSAKAVESLLSRARSQLRGLLRFYFSTPTGDERHEPSDARPA
jgi:RNA polymerase sigma factor (sigma-70 family)